ncbi:MAG: caspase family protein [Betaproteobacteria bacterium]|nr:caspase family protein [Betaproteobacteria bacterium]
MISRLCFAIIASGFALMFTAPPAAAQPVQQRPAAAPAAAAPEPRAALVIGNSAYAASPLKNPTNDATDVANALREFGFRVVLMTDADQHAMRQALREFGRELKRGGIGLFYFAGHGVQSKGRNFLVPVGVNIESEAELEDQAVDANLVLGYMEDAANRVNIVILDACRNNPFARSFRSASRGLAQMDAAKGSFLAFATAPGSVASDGTGRNGLYTERLLESLKQPDSDIDKVFRRVAADVSTLTQGRQMPWVASSLTADFSFQDPLAARSNARPGAAALEGRLTGTAATVDSRSSELAAAQPPAFPRAEPTFTMLEQARSTARENVIHNARRWRSQLFPNHEIFSHGDSTQEPDCPQGDGWATVDLYDRHSKLAVQLKCSTVSPNIGCLEAGDFKTKPYAHEDGTCQPTSKVPFPLPKFAR